MTSIQIDRTDGLSSSTAIKGPVKAATTANITLSGEQTIDGVALVTGDRVLVKDQTSGLDNGIWKVSTGVWSRAKDFSSNRDVKNGSLVIVSGGTVNAGLWQVTTADPIAIGTTSLTFVLVSNASLVGAPDHVRDYLDVAPYVATRTALKALDTTKDMVAILTESGREGTFTWRTGDFSSLITADAAEGLYVKANAIASTAGAWVRKRDNLDAPIEWFGGGAAMSAAVNDAAFTSAKALSMVATVLYGIGTYDHATTLAVGARHGFGIRGIAAFPVFGSATTSGTIIRWTGASSGIIATIWEPSGNDTYQNRIIGIDFDGNGLASVGIDIRQAQYPLVDGVDVRNLLTTGTSIGLRLTSQSVAGTGINAVYRGRFNNLRVTVTGAAIPLYISGVSGVGGCTFCTFDRVHVTHENGIAIYINNADDCTFYNVGTNRVAGGTGLSLSLDGTGTGVAYANTFYQFHAGAADGTCTISAAGAQSRQNKIYGLSGVDKQPVVSQTSGARLQYDYMGGGYTATDAAEAALNLMVAAHITTLRLGSDYTTYATGTRDVNANDKVIWNNPGTGGYQWQLGGTSVLNLTSTLVSMIGVNPSYYIESTGVGAGASAGISMKTGNSANVWQAITKAGGYVIGVQSVADYTTWSTTGDITHAGNFYVGTGKIAAPQTNDGAALGSTALQWSDLFLASGGVINFNNGNYTITHTAGALTFSGAVLSSGTGGIGYATGAGGTVTQATSKSTGVTLNKATGQITLNAAALAASTTVSFVLTNSAIAATDLLVLNHVSGGTPGSYTLNGRAAAGSATIDVRNVSLGSLSEAIVIGYAVVKAVTA